MYRQWMMIAMAASCLLFGCADAAESPETPKPQANPDGTIGTDIDDSGDENDNTSKEDDDNHRPNPEGGSDASGGGGSGSGGSSGGGDSSGGGTETPTKECSSGQMDCDANGNVKSCNAEKWVITECKGICEKGVCNAYNDNSCTNPYIVKSGEAAVSGSTNTSQSYSPAATLSTCRRFKGSMAAAKLDIPKLGYYTVKATIKQSVSSWGVFEALSCEPEKIYQDDCNTTNGDKELSFTRLLGPGEFYVYASGLDQEKGVPAPFEFELSLSETEDKKANACGYKGDKIEIIDAAQKTLSLTGKTSEGSAAVLAGEINGIRCNNSSAGKEVAYAFQITQQVSVSATMAVTRTDDGTSCIDENGFKNKTCSSQALIHIQKCSGSSNLGKTTNTVTCNMLNIAKDHETLTLEKIVLEPGEYFLFVDSDSSFTSYAYSLELTFE